MEAATKLEHPYNHMIVEFKDDTNIPLELILARLQDSSTYIIKKVINAEDGIVSMGVMERGSDGVVLANSMHQEIIDLAKKLEKQNSRKIKIVDAEILGIKHIDMGERACIDTTSMLKKDEGMIVGSTSRGGILIASEVHPLPYMNTRPFRVNAGAVHSYVWGPDNMVEYITDLRAGKEILCATINGEVRTVNVGRIKIEVRPLLLIEAKVNDIKINVIVQDDWHMRVFSSKGEIINVTNLKPGDMVKAYVCEPGRHVGIKIEETIIEK
jgi:3-amino-4-hydroxybenzoic acid synthase